MTTRRPAVLAIDGGNSKADVALLAADGTVLGAVRGPTISHQAVPLPEATSRLRMLIDQVRIAGQKDAPPAEAKGRQVAVFAGNVEKEIQPFSTDQDPKVAEAARQALRVLASNR